MILIIDKPDAFKGNFDHWMMWNIPVNDKIDENSSLGTQGKNGKMKIHAPGLVLLLVTIIIISGCMPPIQNRIFK